MNCECYCDIDGDGSICSHCATKSFIKRRGTYHDALRYTLKSGDREMFIELLGKRCRNKKQLKRIMISIACHGTARHCLDVFEHDWRFLEYDDAVNWAAGMGNLPVLQVLLDKGVVLRDDKNYLYWPSINGHLSVVQYLVSKGVDPKNYPEALKGAAKHGHQNVVDYLTSLIVE